MEIQGAMEMNSARLLIIIVAVASLASACAFTNAAAPDMTQADLMDDRFGTRYIAAEIFTNLSVPSVRNYPIIVTTFVNLNELERTSVFGRMMAEKLLDELNRKGFTVVEIRRAQDLFVKKAAVNVDKNVDKNSVPGEFILTRDTSELAGRTNARAVLAGTYVATTDMLIINARLVDIKTPRILASVSYEVRITEEIESLLTGMSPFY